MDAERLAIDPEVEAILREIASDSDSTLLKVVPEQARRMLCDPRPQVDDSTLLTRAERQLLRVYREEVAILLRRACLIDCFEDASVQDVLHRELTVDRQLSVPDRKHWERGSRWMLDTCPEEADCRDGLDVLNACVANWNERPSVAALASASLRLAPSNEARMYHAFDLWRDGELDDAFRLLHYTVDRSHSALTTSIAWEHIGSMHFGTGRYVEACDSYAQASRTGEQRGEPLMSWLLLALGLSRHDEAIRASKMLEEQLGIDDAALDRYVVHLRRFWRTGAVAPSATARRTLRDVESRLGRISRSAASILADDSRARTFLCVVLVGACVGSAVSSQVGATPQTHTLPPTIAQIKDTASVPTIGRIPHP